MVSAFLSEAFRNGFQSSFSIQSVIQNERIVLPFCCHPPPPHHNPAQATTTWLEDGLIPRHAQLLRCVLYRIWRGIYAIL